MLRYKQDSLPVPQLLEKCELEKIIQPIQLSTTIFSLIDVLITLNTQVINTP